MWRANRHALQHPIAEGLVQPQPVEVDVANMTPAGVIATRALNQAALEIRGVQVADRLPNEVAAADRSVTVHRDDRRPRPTRLAAAAVAVIVDREQGVEAGPLL